MNKIAYALFGTNPAYREGFLQNVEAARKTFPGWHIPVYCDQVNHEALRPLGLARHHHHPSTNAQQRRGGHDLAVSGRRLPRSRSRDLPRHGFHPDWTRKDGRGRVAGKLLDYGDDQRFPSSQFYPRIKRQALVHTSLIKYMFEYALPLPPEGAGESFIGAYFSNRSDEENQRLAKLKAQAKPMTLMPYS